MGGIHVYLGHKVLCNQFHRTNFFFDVAIVTQTQNFQHFRNRKFSIIGGIKAIDTTTKQIHYDIRKID
jgi:hypothetical protein